MCTTAKESKAWADEVICWSHTAGKDRGRFQTRQFDSRAIDYNYSILCLQALAGHKAALWIANWGVWVARAGIFHQKCEPGSLCHIDRCQQPDSVDRRPAVSTRHGLFSHLRVGSETRMSSLPCWEVAPSLRAWVLYFPCSDSVTSGWEPFPVAQAFPGACGHVLATGFFAVHREVTEM